MIDDSIDQFTLPWATASGQAEERILGVDEFETWSLKRAGRCGHRDFPLRTCRICQGTLKVSEQFSAGNTRVRVYPMR